MRQAAEAEGAAPHFEAPAGAGQVEIDHLRRLSGQRAREAQPLRIQAARLQQPGERHAHQPLRAAVREHCLAALVESDHRHLDLVHHPAQQRARFQRSDALRVQGVGELIDLQQELGQRVARTGAAPAHREILLAQGGDQVGRRLQRAQHALAHRQRDEEPDQHHQRADRPADLAVLHPQPEEDQRRHHGGQPGPERENEDVQVVRQLPLHSAFKPCCCSRR